MSMREYGYSDYGMILDNVAEKEILKRTDYEGLYDMWIDNRCLYVGGFTGTACQLTEGGLPSWSDDYMFDDDQLYYVELNNCPSLCRQAYRSVEDVVAELKNKLSGLLPDDFDIRSRLCFISGTYCG